MVIQICVLLNVLSTLAMATGTRIHIVGGHEAVENGHPWLLALEKMGFITCGASLIRMENGVNASDIAITAAHCICGNNSQQLQFRRMDAVAGKYHRNEDSNNQQKREIMAHVCHPKFQRSTGDADVALIKFSSPIQFNGKIHPIDVAAAGQTEEIGKECIVAGWGGMNKHDNDSFPSMASVLQELHLEVAPENLCKIYSLFSPSKMICAKAKGKEGTPCVADSGGPLMCKDQDGHAVLHGVVSFGNDECDPNLPAVYTRLSSYGRWVHDTIHELASHQRK